MIVDDSTFNINSLIKLLNKLNITADIAYDGKECIKKLLERKHQCVICDGNYKLILMDCEMPVMNGMEATK